MKKQTLCSLLFLFIICFSANVSGQYQINGNATSLGSNCFRLNPDLENQVGSVWNKDVLNLNFPFDFTFNVNLGCTNATSGDGICFGLQPLSSGIGVGGNGMGMIGISPSVGVFIDTYENYWDTDPAYDHISLNANGDVDHTTSNNLAGPFQASSTSADIEDCVDHKLRVRWDPSAKNYKVWFDDVQRISYTGNIITTIFSGNPNVYWGFTGATGLYHNDQRFCLILAANFSATTACSGIATTFTDLSNSANPITNWAWDFGDGTPVFSGAAAGTYKNPSHVYAVAGTYTVQQTVTSSAGVSIISHNITVKPSPVITATPTSMEFCSGGKAAITLKSSLSSATIAWTTSATGGTVTGYSGGTGTSISQTLNATASTAGIVTYNVTGTLNGCTGTVAVPVKVNPIPIVTITSPSAVCAGTSATLTSATSPAGGTYLWSNGAATTSISVSPTTTTTYTLTYTLGTGCKKTVTGITTITPLQDANFSYAKSTYCGNALDTFPNFIATAPGTFSASPAGLSLNAVTGKISPSASLLNTYAIKYTTGGTCPGTKTVNLTIAFNPTADFMYALGSYCQYTGTVLPTFTGTSSAGTFSAIPAGLVFVNTSTGEIDLNASTPGSYIVKNIISKNGTCQADTSAPVAITIKAAPVLIPSTKIQTVCSPGTTSILLTGGTSYDWITSSPVTITGASNVTGNISGSIAQTLTTSDVIPGVVHYIITPHANGCVGKSDSVHVTVNPVPTVSATPVTPAVCSGLITNIKLSSSIPTAMFTWTVLTQTNASGASAGTGSTIEQALTATVSSPGTVIYHIIPAAFGSCNGNPIDVQVIVNPNPATAVTIPASDRVICSGEITHINLSSSTAGTVFSWTVNQSGVSGGTSGTGNQINDVLTALGNTPGKAVYVITGTANLCSGTTVMDSIIVNPIPTLTATPLKQEICSGAQTNIALVSNLPGAFFSWTVVPGTITGASNGSTTVGNIIQTLANTGITAGTILYYIVTTANGCSSDSILAKITVNPLPKINMDSVKINASNCGTLTGSITGLAMLSGIAPLKYEWKNSQGTIIGTNLILNPALPGIYTLKVTDANGCSAIIGTNNKLNIQTIKSVNAFFTSDVTSGETPLYVQFHNQSTSTGTINYNWDFGNGSTSILKDPAATFDMAREYSVCLSVDDGVNGCRDTVCSLIEAETNPDLLIVPNVFTPNGDGINDVLMITAKGLEAVNAQIYNRWGEKLYEWNTLFGGWDGFTVSGVPASEGTYYIILVATGADKKKTALPPVKQSFTLLR